MSPGSASCGRFHSEKFSVARPLSTSCCVIHETGATLLYHGHVVSFEWQSKHASFVSCRTAVDDHFGSAVVGGLVCARPYGTSWIARNSAIPPRTIHMIQRRIAHRT